MSWFIYAKKISNEILLIIVFLLHNIMEKLQLLGVCFIALKKKKKQAYPQSLFNKATTYVLYASQLRRQ